jgi:hypothetical protein
MDEPSAPLALALPFDASLGLEDDGPERLWEEVGVEVGLDSGVGDVLGGRIPVGNRLSRPDGVRGCAHPQPSWFVDADARPGSARAEASGGLT